MVAKCHLCEKLLEKNGKILQAYEVRYFGDKPRKCCNSCLGKQDVKPEDKKK